MPLGSLPLLQHSTTLVLLISWQIVPSVLGELLNDDDNQKSDRVMQAMLKMDKLDIKILKQAYAVDPAKLKPQIEIRDTYE
jgi:hypothetical protein